MTSRTKTPQTTQAQPPKKEERPRERELERKTQMLQRPVERIGVKIRSVARDLFVRRHIEVLAVEPIDVRPAKAEPDVMRIAFVVGMGVMLAMNGDPTNRIALERERSKDRKKIFERLAQANAAMRQHAVIAQRHAQDAGEVRKDRRDGDIRKMKKRRHESGQRTNMNDAESNPRTVPCRSIHRLSSFVAHASGSYEREPARSRLSRFLAAVLAVPNGTSAGWRNNRGNKPACRLAAETEPRQRRRIGCTLP